MLSRTRRSRDIRIPGGRARIGPWRGADDVALIGLSVRKTPDATDLGPVLDAARGAGFARAVTRPLGPVAARAFAEAGFVATEALHLLRHDLGALPEPGRPTRRARRHDRAAVLALDHDAFSPAWRLAPDGIDETRRATPHARWRIAIDRDALAGYCITGRSGTEGYVQRLATGPDHRRRGVARSLLADALAWLVRRGASRAYVNTPVGNDGALALYTAVGFRLLPDGLVVAERSL